MYLYVNMYFNIALVVDSVIYSVIKLFSEYLATGEQLERGRGGGRLPCHFSKYWKKCPNLWKKYPECDLLWVKFLI